MMLQNNNHKSGVEVCTQIEAMKKRRQEEEEERKRKEAEAEAEEAKQLAELEAAEERERVAEAERVAEEARKQEEEQRRRAAEVAAQQGAAGGSGDGPMDVDRMAEEEEKTKKKKNNGKGKQTAEDEDEEEMELVGGAGRCHACVRDNEQCRINTRAILRWRTNVEAGRVTARAPTGTSCQRCNTSLHRPCCKGTFPSPSLSLPQPLFTTRNFRRTSVHHSLL